MRLRIKEFIIFFMIFFSLVPESFATEPNEAWNELSEIPEKRTSSAAVSLNEKSMWLEDWTTKTTTPTQCLCMNQTLILGAQERQCQFHCIIWMQQHTMTKSMWLEDM